MRPPSPENASHLYDDDLDLRAVLHRAGFAPSGRFGDYVTYRRVDPSDKSQQLRVLFDRLVLTSGSWSGIIRRQRRRLAVALLDGQGLSSSVDERGQTEAWVIAWAATRMARL